MTVKPLASSAFAMSAASLTGFGSGTSLYAPLPMTRARRGGLAAGDCPNAAVATRTAARARKPVRSTLSMGAHCIESTHGSLPARNRRRATAHDEHHARSRRACPPRILHRECDRRAARAHAIAEGCAPHPAGRRSLREHLRLQGVHLEPRGYSLPRV